VRASAPCRAAEHEPLMRSLCGDLRRCSSGHTCTLCERRRRSSAAQALYLASGRWPGYHIATISAVIAL